MFPKQYDSQEEVFIIAVNKKKTALNCKLAAADRDDKQ